MSDPDRFRHDFSGGFVCVKCAESIYEVGRDSICHADVKPLATEGFFDDEPLSVWRKRIAAMNKPKEKTSA